MTNTISNDIRACLEKTLKNVSGIPSQIEFDGVPITPTPDTAFVVCTNISLGNVPATIGIAPQYLQEGNFNITLYYPVGKGAGEIEAMADTIAAAYPVDQTISHGLALLRVRSAGSSGQVRVEAGLWLTLLVTVSWYVYN